MTRNTVITQLREACQDIGGAAKWAERHKMSRTYLLDILAKRKPPNETVLRALGLERVEDYRRIQA
jgi:hypothetical protein